MNEPKKFRKKPVVIEAMQFTGYNTREVVEWIRENGRGAVTITGRSDFIDIVTLEGTMRADKNDMIIKGIKGEFYPCKPDIFGDTYEAV